MSKIQVNNKNNCGYLTDSQLTLKAKGLLAIISSMPNDWKFSINRIMEIIPEGKTVIYSVINELKKKGYCVIVPVRDNHGRVQGNNYSFFEKPNTDIPHTEKPYLENPHTDNGQLGLVLETADNENEIEQKDSRILYDQIKNMWNEKCSMLSSVTVLSPKRKEKIRARFDEFSSVGEPMEVLFTLLDKIARSKWLTVDSRENWRKGLFDWLFSNSENWVKVWEGKYDDQIQTTPVRTYVERKNDYWQ